MKEQGAKLYFLRGMLNSCIVHDRFEEHSLEKQKGKIIPMKHHVQRFLQTEGLAAGLVLFVRTLEHDQPFSDDLSPQPFYLTLP